MACFITMRTTHMINMLCLRYVNYTYPLERENQLGIYPHLSSYQGDNYKAL